MKRWTNASCSACSLCCFSVFCENYKLCRFLRYFGNSDQCSLDWHLVLQLLWLHKLLQSGYFQTCCKTTKTTLWTWWRVAFYGTATIAFSVVDCFVHKDIRNGTQMLKMEKPKRANRNQNKKFWQENQSGSRNWYAKPTRKPKPKQKLTRKTDHWNRSQNRNWHAKLKLKQKKTLKPKLKQKPKPNRQRTGAEQRRNRSRTEAEPKPKRNSTVM